MQSLASIVTGAASCLFTPTLNFRFCKHELSKNRFQNDAGFLGMPKDKTPAYCTAYKIEPWRISLIGSVFAGVNFELLDRVKKDPLLVAEGITQLAGAALVMSYVGTEAYTAAYLAGFALG